MPPARLQSFVLRLLLYGGGGLGTYGADCLVDDDVKELVAISSGFFLNELAHALAGSGIVGEAEAALFSGHLSELFDDVEEGFFVVTAEQPSVMDGGGDTERSGRAASEASCQFWRWVSRADPFHGAREDAGRGGQAALGRGRVGAPLALRRRDHVSGDASDAARSLASSTCT